MPLNYSKWDQLEVSDDSDIEGHPNVDHKSLVRMKQRTIHEQRYARNQLIAQLEADLALNAELLPRARKIASELKASDDKPAFFSRTVDRLKNAPDPAGPAGGGDSYETMLYHLMLTVYEDVKKAGVKQDDDKLGQALQDALDTHVKGLEEDTKKKEVQLDGEKKEKAKKITTEDIHEGFQSAYVPAKPDPAPVPGADSLAPKTKGKGKQKETTIEVLNPKASGSADVSQEDEDDEDSDLPQLTPALVEFSKIPIGRFEQSYQFIQAHRDVIVPGAADALLVAAFDAQGNGKPKYSKQCVHQSLLVQYCEKLGGDGVRVFFMKMISGDKRATDVFVKDVEETYQHLKGRVAASKEASPGSGEQIQIVAEGGADSVSFNVPDGPPPAELVLEGEGVQDLDVEEVRKVLQMRWDVFEGFSDELKQALRLNSLDAVNAVLGKMSVEEAEGVVGMLDMGGILNFAEGGVRDETPAGKAAAAAATEPSASESAESAPKDA